MTLYLGDTAPDFTTDTTIGEISFHEWAGDNWVALFSHPADFTPVCTTEFVGFAKRVEEFDALNTQLIGLSIDSVHSHIAWARDIEENWGQEIPFPIIADLDMKVAKAYGMLHPGESATAAVRAVSRMTRRTRANVVADWFGAMGRKCRICVEN